MISFERSTERNFQPSPSPRSGAALNTSRRDRGAALEETMPTHFPPNQLPTDVAERASLLVRLMERVRKTDSCWNWTGYRSRFGYGYIWTDGKTRRLVVHRVAYELLKGPIPEGLTIDHLCRNEACCNPAHMEPVTSEENLRRKPKPTHCKNGHPFSGDNLFLRDDGARLCHACASDRSARYRERLKSKAQ